MCGIVAIVSRPSSRPTPSADEIVALLDRRLPPTTLTDAAVVVAEVDRLLHGVPGMLALVGRSELIAGITARLDQLDGRIADRERELEEGPAVGPTRSRPSTPSCSPPRRGVGRSQGSPAHRRRRRRLRRSRRRAPRPSPATCRSSRRCRPSTAWRCAAATAPASTCSCGTTGSTSADPSVAAARRAARPSTRCSRSGRCASADGRLAFVYKAAAEIGELGDNVEGAARSGARRRPAAPRARSARRPGVGARPHPLGQRRHHQRAQLPPGERRAGRAERPAAERRPAAAVHVAVLNGDVDNHADIKVNHALRIAGPITTDAKVIPAVMALHAAATARSRRGVPPHGRRVRGQRRHRRRRRPTRPTSRTSRCAAAARRCTSASATTCSSSPASPTAWSRRRCSSCASTARPRRRPAAAARCSCSTARRPARSAGVRRIAYDGSELPIDAERDRHRAGHHPRHRPRRCPALPAEGDRRGAEQLPQDAARQDRRDAARPARRSGRAHAARRRSPRGSPTARSPRCASSARAPRPSPGAAWPRCSTRSSTARSTSTPSPPPSCPASTCGSTCPTR